VVTPSFNQAQFLERTMRSVLDQGYPNLEYIVIDGASTDGSREIIERYADRLAYWVSEKDRGQAHAINKGLQRATGEWVAWQNSDDVYYPGAFDSLARAALHNPAADLIIGNVLLIDAEDRVLRDLRYVKPTYRALLAEGMVLMNQAAFWRRSAHDTVGWIDESLYCAFDYDWFLRLLQHGRAAHVDRFWGGWRLHGETKTSQFGERCQEEHRQLLAGRELGRWEKDVLRLRRMLSLLAQGHFGYVARGLLRRSTGIGRQVQ
jgi:glycosyltransferase involved in cell wall biosynthesis